jgi:hypothetical protein
MIDVGLGVALIILASAILHYVKNRDNESVPDTIEKRLTARMNELDRRLTDIQDVKITIDEKLSRIERQDQ